MNIRIGDYEIKTLDEHNFVLVEHYKTKSGTFIGKEVVGGEDRDKTVGYYGRLDIALNSLVNKQLLNKSDVSSVETLLEAFNTLKQCIELECSKIKGII